MSSLYPDNIIIERFLASVSAETLPQKFIAPIDLDVVGMLLTVGTAPGATDGVAVNVSNFPTSQQGGALSSVSAYNLWTTANRPTILGTATNSFTTSNSGTVIDNVPYALNYPLPGQSPVTGYETSQATAVGTYTAVTAPPSLYQFELPLPLQAPDNTYTDYNGVLLKSAAHVHAGDVLSFVISAAGSAVSVGAAANLEIVLLVQKR